MSVALFDLGQQLRAAAESRPLPRSTFATVLLPVDPVAVTITGSGNVVLLRASDGARQLTASGPDALSALSELGVSVGSDWRTLVVADRDALAHLLELAYTADPAGDYAGLVGPACRPSGQRRRPGRGGRLLCPMGTG